MQTTRHNSFVIGEILSVKGHYKFHWNILLQNNTFEGAHSYRIGLEEYQTALLQGRDLAFERKNLISTFKSTPGTYAVQADKCTADTYKLKGVRAELQPDHYWKFPNWELRQWDEFRKGLRESLNPVDSVDGSYKSINLFHSLLTCIV